MHWPAPVAERLSAMILSGFPRELPGPRTVGVEDEIPVVNPDGSMGDAQKVLEFLARDPHWQPVYKDGRLDGCSNPRLGYITTDAGLGTNETNSKPTQTLHELARHKEERNGVFAKYVRLTGQTALGYGISPVTVPHEMYWHNKQRYNILKRRLHPSVHLATTAASTQVHVSVARDEAIPVADTMTALSGPIIAICQNSPVHEGAIDPQGRNAVREELWDGISLPDRPTIPPQPFHTLENYVDFMLSCETFMLPDPKHPDRVLPCDVKLGRVLQSEKNPNGYCRRIVNLHEGTVWISTRPRSIFGTVEIRVMCQQPFSTGVAVEALILGAVCQWKSLHKVVMHYPWELWLKMRYVANREGLDGVVDGIKIRDIAKLLLTSAYTGLYNRDFGEEAYLGEIRDRVYGAKPVPAQIARDAFKRGGIPELVRTFAYC